MPVWLIVVIVGLELGGVRFFLAVVSRKPHRGGVRIKGNRPKTEERA